MKTEFAGKRWFYDFRELPNRFKEEIWLKNSKSLSSRYSKITKEWNEENNSEWLCRIYFSAKMIMMATLQLNALKYAQEKNLRVVSSYLAYYSLISLLRGIVYTLPEVMWNNGGLIQIGHEKAINLAFDCIAKFNKQLSVELKEYVLRVKAYRELISYRAPSSGDRDIQGFCDLVSNATLFAELAQFNSELLEESILKNASKESFVFLKEYSRVLSEVKVGTFKFKDKEDSYRLGYLRRKSPAPSNILHILTEGHVEDFFGAWVSEEEIDGSFNPDKNWQLIFDMP